MRLLFLEWGILVVILFSIHEVYAGVWNVALVLVAAWFCIVIISVFGLCLSLS